MISLENFEHYQRICSQFGLIPIPSLAEIKSFVEPDPILYWYLLRKTSLQPRASEVEK
jgi:hypothetical protein